MKITKQYLKRLIKEEFEDMPSMDTDVFASQKGLDLEMIRTLACTKLGQAAVVTMAEAILDDPANIEEAIKPLARMANVDVVALVDAIKNASIPNALIPSQLKSLGVKTIGDALELLGGFAGLMLKPLLKPMLPQAVAAVCSLDTLEENKLPKRTSTMKITKQYLKRLIKEELEKILHEGLPERAQDAWDELEDEDFDDEPPAPKPKPAAKPVPKPAAKPVPKPVAKPVPKPAPEKEKAPATVRKAKATQRNFKVVGMKREGNFIVVTVKDEKSGMTATGKQKFRGNMSGAKAGARQRANKALAHKLQQQKKP